MLITFSGLDAAGKSTQIHLLLAHLRRCWVTPIYIWTRGGSTPLFELLRRSFRRAAGGPVAGVGQRLFRSRKVKYRWVRIVWLWLATAELLWIYGVQLRWHRRRKRVIICDRYVWDTLVDFRTMFPEFPIERWWIWRQLTRWAPSPDHAFLLLVPVDESAQRSQQKADPYRYPPELLKQRLAQYEALTGLAGWHVLDGRRAPEELAAEIVAVAGL
ncbi:MAG: hypothetical protein HY872_16675 [Chloroflexi bacterium]|nr:hypothetical protein [Chloroflexota bacterium]